MKAFFRTLLAAAALVAALPHLASAQSTCPYIAQGAVLTAGQWNQCFANKQDGLGFVPVNKAGDVMLGKLTMLQSTASGAGLNLPQGSAPATPNNGDVWTTLTGMYARINGSTIGPFGAISASSFAATSPLAVTFPAGVVTYALAYDSNFTNTANQLALATGGLAIPPSVTGGAKGSGTINLGGSLYNNNVAPTGSGGGYVLATAPTISALIVTGSFTATGLVTNADLANSSTTVNGQVCTLGSTCTITVSVSTGITGLGTGIATALAVNVGSAGAPVIQNGALGTPSSGTLTNALGLPVGGIAAIANNTVIGNVSGISAVPAALTATQLTTLCNQFSTTLTGCVPASTTTSGQVLSDGGWIPAPSGTGTVTSVSATTGVATTTGSAITGTGTLIATGIVNAQTGTTYTYVDGDRAKLVTHTNGSSIAGTLPQAGASSTFISGWYMDVQNRGAGTLTITPTTSTIDGAASITLATNQGIRIFSDGTNYFTQRGRENNNGTVTSITCNGGLTGGAITTSGTCAADIATASNFYGATANKLLDASVIYTSEVTTTFGATTTFNFDNFINTAVTLTGNITTMTLSNVRAGKSGTIRFIQDGTGSRTTVWNSAFKWAGGSSPTLSTAANAVDVLSYFCISATYCVASLIKAVS